MKIAITGASGQLGQLVVSKLKEKISAENIVGLVRSLEKGKSFGVDLREADYTDFSTLEKALDGIDTLLLISSSEVGQRAVQHSNIIEAAKKADVKWIVYTSLLHADTSVLSLAEEHRATEAMLEASGIPYTLLRNGWYTENYAGSIAGSIAGAVAGGAFIGSAGDGKISSAARADFADAAVAVLTSEGHKGETYELAGDDHYTLSDLAAEISVQTGKDIPYKNLSEADYSNALVGFGLPSALSNAIASWDVAASKGDLFDDGRQLSKLIGRPTTALSVVVAEALEGQAA